MQSNPSPDLAEVNRHMIGEILATGSLGVVYRAREAVTGRDIALKRLHAAYRIEAAPAASFMHQARLTALLEHPNVVPVHDVTTDEEGCPYYTMKMVNGRSLAEVLAALAQGDVRTARGYPLASLLTIFQKVCDAVAFAHSKGAAHRNLNPASIMIGQYGEVVLMGWGKNGRTDTSDPGRDRLKDGYALGTILYEILALQPAFSDRSPGETAAEGSAPPPPAWPRTGRRPHLPGGKIPGSLAAVTVKALAPDPTRRYPWVQALQADIRAYQSGFATAAESAGPWRQFLLFAARHRNVAVALAMSFSLIAFISALYGVEIWRANLIANADRSAAVAALKSSVVETTKAEEALGRLSHLGPEFFANAGELMKAGRFPEALEHLGYAVDVEANNADYQLAKAHLEQASEQLTEAVASYQRVLQLRPDPSAQTNLELSLQLLGEGRGARPLSIAQRKRLAEAIIFQGRSGQSPHAVFRTDES